MKTVRSRIATLGLATLAVLGASACEPLLNVPPRVVPAPSGAQLTVGSSTLPRGGTTVVTTRGCADDFTFAEVRLVVGSGDDQRSIVVTSTSGDEPVDIEVPNWAPTGPAEVQASCLEPNFSGASDGADILLFDFAPVPVTITSGSGSAPARRVTIENPVTDSTLRISGSGCYDSVLVRVSRGPSMIASSSRFHYGSHLVEPAADGTWSAEIPLSYSVATFNDPLAPSPMAAFATCDGQQFEPARFDVVGDDGPAVQLLGSSTLYLSQCPEENQLSILGVIERADGSIEYVGHETTGFGYGERFTTLDIPDDAVTVLWVASCSGAYNPSFVYQPAVWSAGAP